MGLFTLKDAERSLRQRGVRRGQRTRSIQGKYSKEQIFDEWLRLERQDMSWLVELPECPKKLKPECTLEGWHDPTAANPLHPEGVYEIRSHTTPRGHSNQCIYDANEDLMTSFPAAGSADFVACPYPPVCPGHFFHDVRPFFYADDLGRIDEYYSVRPVK
jgi:hypothetical protein